MMAEDQQTPLPPPKSGSRGSPSAFSQSSSSSTVPSLAPISYVSDDSPPTPATSDAGADVNVFYTPQRSPSSCVSIGSSPLERLRQNANQSILDVTSDAEDDNDEDGTFATSDFYQEEDEQLLERLSFLYVEDGIGPHAGEISALDASGLDVSGIAEDQGDEVAHDDFPPALPPPPEVSPSYDMDSSIVVTSPEYHSPKRMCCAAPCSSRPLCEDQRALSNERAPPGFGRWMVESTNGISETFLDSLCPATSASTDPDVDAAVRSHTHSVSTNLCGAVGDVYDSTVQANERIRKRCEDDLIYLLGSRGEVPEGEKQVLGRLLCLGENYDTNNNAARGGDGRGGGAVPSSSSRGPVFEPQRVIRNRAGESVKLRARRIRRLREERMMFERRNSGYVVDSGRADNNCAAPIGSGRVDGRPLREASCSPTAFSPVPSVHPDGPDSAQAQGLVDLSSLSIPATRSMDDQESTYAATSVTVKTGRSSQNGGTPAELRALGRMIGDCMEPIPQFSLPHDDNSQEGREKQRQYKSKRNAKGPTVDDEDLCYDSDPGELVFPRIRSDESARSTRSAMRRSGRPELGRRCLSASPVFDGKHRYGGAAAGGGTGSHPAPTSPIPPPQADDENEDNFFDTGGALWDGAVLSHDDSATTNLTTPDAILGEDDKVISNSVQESLNKTWTLTWHPGKCEKNQKDKSALESKSQRRDPAASSPKCIHLWFERGSRLRDPTIIEPKLMWREAYQPNLAKRRVLNASTQRPHFVNVLSICRLLECTTDSLDRAEYPLAKRKCSFVLRTCTDEEYLFEAGSEEERDGILSSWKLVVARLASQAVVGDGEGMVNEFFTPSAYEVPGGI